MGKMTWPLVLFFVVLPTIATCALAPAKEPSACDICHPGKEGRIRLRDHARNGSAGLIEVCSHGYWQTICGATDQFTENDSSVTCFQLGFTGGDPVRVLGSACLPDQHTYLVVDPPCQGWEEKLSDCGLPSIPAGACTPRTAVSVTCEATVQVKLMHGGASSYLGTAMHYFNSSWRTVCDGDWTSKMSNSHVLCWQLGLGHALEHWLQDKGETDIQFLHTNMSCNGSEDKLRMCNHTFTTNDTCNGKSVPWVVCSGPEASDFKISTSYTSITLQWTVPEALQYYPVVQGYSITCGAKEANNQSKIVVHHDQLEVTFRGLTAGTQYHVTVQVVLKDDRPGPATTLIVSTTGAPNADSRVIGLATGLAVCGVLLLCVLLVGGIALLRRRQGNRHLEVELNGNEPPPGEDPPPEGNERQPVLPGQPAEPQQQPAGHYCPLL